MSANNARASSAHSAASTLRPRGKRLISGLDEGDEITFDSANARPNRIASPAPASFDSRSASPIPPAHPQRSPNVLRNRGAGSNGSPTRNSFTKPKKSGADAPSLWNALQGIASDFLGNDLAAPEGRDKQRVRKPFGRLPSVHAPASASLQTWGPSAPTSHPGSGGIGVGTQEEQSAEFRAQKRRDMLTARETSYLDSLGKFKRRLSDDQNSASAPPGENEERDALVYVHHVKKDDTLPGITIRYNISAGILRKANRMWPNDTVQARQTLILPVDACGVKGRPIAGPDGETDFSRSESESLSTLKAVEVSALPASPNMLLPNGSKPRHTRDRTNSSSTLTASSAAVSSVVAELPWQHDSWVMLPEQTSATQIARLPRRALGYFPPARRKSNSYSDLDTPSTSLDLVRANAGDVTHPAASPLRQTPPQRAQRGRRPSNATNGYFPTYLTGPGGVGTMSRNVHFPGPAQDGLNKMFAKHLPDVAPPRNQNVLYQPGMPLHTDEPTSGGSGSVTPAFPHTSGGNLSLNIENVGGAIESWVRRMAYKAVNTPQDRQQTRRVSVGTPGRGAGGIGDLIEMTDEFEIGDDEQDERDRGRQGSSQAVPIGAPGSSAVGYFEGATMRGKEMSGVNGKNGKVD